MTNRRRSVRQNERDTYDACHQAMRDGRIYAWNISLHDGTWSIQSAAGVFVLDGASQGDVRRYLGLDVKRPGAVTVLRSRVAQLEAMLAEAGLAIPEAVAA